MKQSINITYMIVIAVITSVSQAQTFQRNAGITVRGSFWYTDDEFTSVSVHDCGNSDVSVGKSGGSITFYNRIDEKWFMELGFGGAARVRVKERNWFDEDVHVAGVAPIMMGALYYPMGQTTKNGLQPFVSFGGGPYWVTEVDVQDQLFSCDDCVSTRTDLQPGIYCGAGTNFMLSTWFGFVLDFKYHLVNFNLNHNESGLEFAMGLSFFWGKYNESSY